MRRLVPVIAAAALVVGGTIPFSLFSSTVEADPEFNDHNCAGAFVSAFASPGFGPAVAVAAHSQAVDNFGLADCGQDNRNNP